jgi:hypothetical protein
VKVVPTNAVAIPETSSSTRTRSIASRTSRKWSNASGSFPCRDVGGGHEIGLGGVRARGDRAHIAEHREVADGDDVHARVAPGVAVGAELREQAGDVDARLLGQLAPGRLVQRLVRPLEAARDRPHPLEGLLAAADEQHVERALDHGQDHDVDGDREGGELRRS